MNTINLNFEDSFLQDEKIQKIMEKNALNGIKKTKVTMIIRNKDGRELFRDLGSNSSLIGGVQEYVKHMWQINDSQLVEFKNLETYYPNGATNVTYTGSDRVVFGYGIATDGALGSSVNAVKRHSLGFSTNPSKPSLIAFRLETTDLDDTSVHMQKYAFRQEVDQVISGIASTSSGTPGKKDAEYYIKKITPEYKIISAKSRTQLQNNPNDTYLATEDVRCHCRIETKIELEEAVNWFGKYKGSKDNAYFNSIILFAGKPCTETINGVAYPSFRDIIATNKINFSNIALMDTEIVFNYDIYFV